MIRRFVANRSGGVAIFVALSLPVIIGMGALGTEVGMWLMTQRSMQGAADAAAISATFAKTSLATMQNQAYAVAAANGYTNGVNGVIVAANVPWAPDRYAGDASKFEVVISQPQSRLFSILFLPTDPTVSARAVAGLPTKGPCIVGLDGSAKDAVLLDNNVSLSNTNCAITVNSTNGAALDLSNNATIYGPVDVRGGWSLSNNAVLNGSPNKQNDTSMAANPDPYSSTTLGTVPGCTGQAGSGSGTINLTAGHFCSGWNFSNNVTLNLAAGTYYVDTSLTLSNNVTVNGTGGVTIVLNGNYTMSAGNNAVFNLTAQSSGAFAGLAVVDLSTTAVTQTFGNNVSMNIDGALYFPHQNLAFSNNASWVTTSKCTQIIADKIHFSNNAAFESTNCNLVGGFGATVLSLVE